MHFAPVYAIVLLVIAALFVGFNDGVTLPMADNVVTIVGQHLLTLAFLALLIERAVEVYLNNAYGKREMKELQGVRSAQRTVEIIETALDDELARAVPVTASEAANETAANQKVALVDDVRIKLREAKKAKLKAEMDALPNRQKLRVEKSASAATAATFLGAVMALVGVNTLSQVVVIDAETVPAFQQNMFSAVDISVTALILAGGSDGIHQIINRFTSFQDPPV